MKKTAFQYGDVRVKKGSAGPWKISTFTMTEEDVLMINLRALRDSPVMYCPPGTYTKLSHKERGCVMSNTRMERITASEAVRDATGKVLVTGLGLGMVLDGILHKDGVEHVTVIESDKDVLKLVAPAFDGERVEFIHADAKAYKPAKGVKFDYVWHDIWDQIDADNLPDMAAMVRRYQPYAKKQGVWSRKEARRDQRMYA